MTDQTAHHCLSGSFFKLQALPLEKAAVLQVVLDDDVSDSIEHKLHVLGVGGTGEVGVDLLCVPFLVQVLKLGLNVTGCFIKLVGPWGRRGSDLL